MKIGLLLEGGGMRGIYTAGILDVLLEENVIVDGMVCVSAGALFGLNFPSKQKGRALRYNLKYLFDKRYMGWRSFLMTGNMVNKEFAYYKIPFELDKFDNDMYKSSGISVKVPITNVKTGNAEYIDLIDPLAQMEVLRAASALPLVSRMVKIDNDLYLDGGIADSIPIDYMESLGYDKIIVILTRPKNYRKRKATKWVYALRYWRFPKLVEAMANRHEQYNQSLDKLEQLEKDGKVIIVRPSESIKVGRLEKSKDKIQEIYQLGKKDIQMLLDKVYHYLEK